MTTAKPAAWAMQAARTINAKMHQFYRHPDADERMAAIIERESPAAALAEALRAIIAVNPDRGPLFASPGPSALSDGTIWFRVAERREEIARAALDEYDKDVAQQKPALAAIIERESPAAKLAEALRAALDCSYNHKDCCCEWLEAASAALTKYDKENL